MGDSTKKSNFLDELQNLLTTVKFGSIEIYIQDHIITQVTVRNIQKTKVELKKDSKSSARAGKTSGA